MSSLSPLGSNLQSSWLLNSPSMGNVRPLGYFNETPSDRYQCIRSTDNSCLILHTSSLGPKSAIIYTWRAQSPMIGNHLIQLRSGDDRALCLTPRLLVSSGLDERCVWPGSWGSFSFYSLIGLAETTPLLWLRRHSIGCTSNRIGVFIVKIKKETFLLAHGFI